MGARERTNAMAVLCLCGITAGAGADIIYQTQSRSITAASSANGGSLTATAPDFGPFIQTLVSSTTFNQQGGGTANNTGSSTIDCQLDPNSVRAAGHISGEGGTDEGGGDVFGEGSVRIDVTFQIDTATPFNLFALARPGTSLLEEFEIKLKNLDINSDVFELDNTSPPEVVNFSGTLQPGNYRLRYIVETIITGPLQDNEFGLNFTVPAPGTAVLPLLAAAAMRRRRR
ncbi:MAG: hypothetical protein U0637_12955 [Phycisphaerales bacterium]